MAYIQLTSNAACNTYSIDTLQFITELRDQPDTDGEVEEFRRILKLQTSKKYNGVTVVGDAAITTVANVSGTFNGGTYLTIEPGVNMSEFRCVNQEITPVGDCGFDVVENKAEWVSMGNSGEWTEIDWQNVDSLPPGFKPGVDLDGLEGAVQQPFQVEYFGEEMETRANPDDEEEEQYRMIQRLVTRSEMYWVESVYNLDWDLYWDYTVQAGFNNGDGIGIDITSNRDLAYGDYIMVDWSLSAIDAEGSKKVVNRVEYMAKTEWQDITW